MYGWGGGRQNRPVGTADADSPSAATLERRRQADLDFLAKIKTASRDELHALLQVSKGWRVVAIERRLKMLGT